MIGIVGMSGQVLVKDAVSIVAKNVFGNATMSSG